MPYPKVHGDMREINESTQTNTTRIWNPKVSQYRTRGCELKTKPTERITKQATPSNDDAATTVRVARSLDL